MPKNKNTNKQKKKAKGNKTTQNKSAPPKTTKMIAKPVAVEESSESHSPNVEETCLIPQEEISQDNNQDNEEVAAIDDKLDASIVEENDAWFDNKSDTSSNKPVLKDSKGSRKKFKNESQQKTTASVTSKADRKKTDNRKPDESNPSGRKIDNERKSNKRQGGEVNDKNTQKRDDKSKEHQGNGRNDQEESNKYENNQKQKFSDKNKHRSTNVDESRSSYRAEDTNTNQEFWKSRSNTNYGNQYKREADSFDNSHGSSSGGNKGWPKGMNSCRSEDKSPWADHSDKRGKNRDSSPNKRQVSQWNEQSKGANTRWDSPNRNHQSNVEDPEYKEFYYKYRQSSINYVKVKEIDGDLFAMPNEYSLAHCVAEDLNMGSGIAVQFSQQFKQRAELYQQRQRQGGLAILNDKERYIYYLITKRLSNGKPTYHTLWSSLKKLQQHIEQNEVKKLAIPRIGCGLDRLEWSTVKRMLEFIFQNTNVEITVCNFQQQEEDLSTPAAPLKINKKCLVKNVEMPAVQIEAETAIVYLGSEDGYVTEEIDSLSTKFRTVRRDYTTSNRKLGDVIQTWSNNFYALYGCIVKKQKDDLFDYISFQKCINRLKTLNSKKNMFYYVAFQAFVDKSDDLIIIKIVNMLRHSLTGVDIYVCWPQQLAHLMPRDYYS